MSINPLRLVYSKKHHDTELDVCEICGALMFRRHGTFHRQWHERTGTT